MPHGGVFVIRGLAAGKRLDQHGLLALQNLCWRPPRAQPRGDGGKNGDRKQGGQEGPGKLPDGGHGEGGT